MATVAERADRAGAQVDEQIAQATARIRGHDLALGGLVLAAVVLAYATAVILLDKAVVLPEWARQLGLAGFALAVLGVGYAALVRPLLRRVNPLYAAVQVERTIEDAKNTVSGYVEAKDRADVPDAVRAAMGARAARDAGQADVNRAVDHKSLLYAGGVAVALLLTLIVLFFVFRPTQFTSLLRRAFVPFTADPIATRTRLDLLDPAGGNVTVTAGQSVTVKVHVAGKVPSPDADDRLRVRLRHAPDGDYEDLPLEPGESSRDWQLRLPETLIRNGVWYKVAGGDAETPEYQITVRSVPRFTGYDVAYEYPKYVRRLPETTADPHLVGYRGTKVVLVGTANRQVKDGRLVFDPPTREPVAGVPVAGRPDTLRFEFVLEAGGSYRPQFTSAEGERSPDPAPLGIRVLDDFAPQVEILKPEEDEVPIPANGQLEIDGRVGDDFGVESVTLRMRLLGPAEKVLTPKPYQGGKSFRRAKDDTWPRSLDYKDSVDFTKLTDTVGLPVALKEGMVLEYWLEAADNRTKPGPDGPEPDPQVGRSKPKRVRVTPPPPEPERQEKQDTQKQQRKADEQQFQKQQEKKLDNENREPEKKDGQNQPHDQGGKKDNDPAAEKKTDPDQKAGGNDAAPKKPDDAAPPKKNDQPPPKPENGGQDGKTDPNGAKQDGQPKTGEQPPKNGGQQDAGNGGQQQPDQAPPPMTKEQRDLQKQANDLQQKLDQQANQGGQAKPNPAPKDDERAEPGEQKPQPKDGDPQAGNAGQPKPDAGANKTPGAETKPQPNAGTPDSPADPKPEPKSQPDPAGGQTGKPEAVTKPEPKKDAGTPPAGDKPTPQPKQDNGQPQPKDGQKDSSGGGQSKPAAPPEGKQDGPPNPGAPKDDPAGAGQPKLQPKTDPGGDKPPADPNGGGQQQPPQPGAAKPETGGEVKPKDGPPPSDAKPTPKDQSPMPGGTGDQPGEPKPAPQDGGGGDPQPGQAKPKPQPEGKLDPKAGGQGATAQKGQPEPGEDKPAPGDNRTADGQKPPTATDPRPKGGQGGKPPELTPEQKKDFEKAVQDLNSPNEADRKAAQQKLDQTVGKENRQKLEDVAKGLNSADPKEREAAQQKLEGMKKQADQMAAKNGAEGKTDPKGAAGAEPKADPGAKTGDQQASKGGKPEGGPKGKVDPKQVEQALKDLNSKDPKAQQAARDQLDKSIGPDARKEAEGLMKDLQSGDKDRRAEAEQKLKEMRDRAEQQANKGGGGDPKPKDGQPAPGKKPDPKEVEQALNDLNSPDAQTREAAKRKLDEQLGKGTGDKAEQANKDANSGDAFKEGQGRKTRDDIREKAEQMAKGDTPPKGKPISPEEQAELAKKLQDLNSKDDTTRQAAEKALDDKIGKENREQLQEAMNDPQKAAELQQKLKEMAEKGPAGANDPTGRTPKGTGPSTVPLNPEAKADARNRARSAELQLERFEKNRENQEFRDRLGMSDDEYDAFLKRWRKETALRQKEADDLEKADVPPAPTGPVENVGGGRKVEQRTGTGTGRAGVGSAGVAPPDARSALEKFQRGAVKVAPKK
ncbi:MAG: hypothetical protein K2X82_05040 [Gemmataceae bacterium]|nr:hypothetical protein [Gemmataceae bacterium]